MRADTAENAASYFSKDGFCRCHTNIFRPHEFLVAKKDLEQASVDNPKGPQPDISRDQVNPVKPIDIAALATFCEKRQNTRFIASGYKFLVQEASRRRSEEQCCKQEGISK
jgi:hypothetical protein